MAGLRKCVRSAKYLLAFIVVSGFALCNAASAQSSVSLYGQVDAYAAAQKNIGGNTAYAEQSGGMSTSYFGLKGREDLGDNIAAIFALESFFAPQSGQIGRFPGDVYFSRNAYVGLQTPYGTVTTGRQSTNLFISTILFNPLVDSFTFSPIVLQIYLGQGGQGVIGDTGWNNAIQFSTPNFSGLSGAAMYSFGNAAGENGQHKWSAQFLFFHGPFAATGAYQYENYSANAGDIGSALAGVPGLTSQRTAELGATYDFKLIKLYAQYLRTDDRVTTGNFNVDTGQGGVSVPLGVGSILGSYAYSRSTGPATQGAIRRTWALAYDYPLSKRTDIYTAYLSDHLTRKSSGSVLGVGMRAKF